jgi:hypothetical protein
MRSPTLSLIPSTKRLYTSDVFDKCMHFPSISRAAAQSSSSLHALLQHSSDLHPGYAVITPECKATLLPHANSSFHESTHSGPMQTGRILRTFSVHTFSGHTFSGHTFSGHTFSGQFGHSFCSCSGNFCSWHFCGGHFCGGHAVHSFCSGQSGHAVHSFCGGGSNPGFPFQGVSAAGGRLKYHASAMMMAAMAAIAAGGMPYPIV